MRIGKKFYVGFASLLVAAGAFIAVLGATGLDTNAMTITDRRDCNYTDVIVNCGTVSTQELLKVYQNNIDGANGNDRGNRDIRAIFNHYGIYESDITSNTVKKGWLNTNGVITVDGKVVADNAQSLYRVHPGKQVSPITIAGKTYYQGPVAGNYGLGADVFVFYNNDGTFKAAIQASCGNPIPANNKVVPPKPPVKPPVKSCDSLTARKINRTTYEFTASATATNGSEVNASIVDYTYTFGDGTTKKGGNKITHTFADQVAAKNYTVTVTASIKVGDKVEPVTGPNCKTTVKVEGKAVYKCESLSATKIERNVVRFDARASASNATIKSYTFSFGDGNSRTIDTANTTASVTHTYADRAANYTARVTVNMADGSTAPANQNCEARVEIKEKESPDISIIKTVNGKEHIKVPVGTEFTYEITVQNTGNVTLKDAAIRDNAPSEVKLVSAEIGKITNNTWAHTISELKPGESKSFIIKAVYEKYAAGVHKNKVCVDTPTIPGGPDDCDDATTETDEPIKVCDLTDNTIKTIERSEYDEKTMTTDLTKCEDMKVCIIKDKTIKTIKKNEFDESTMTTDLNECAEEVTPPELPQTGIEAFISGTLGLGSITAASYYWSASRKNLLSTLLRK